MNRNLVRIHGKAFASETLERIAALLEEIYGPERGSRNFRYLTEALDRYLDAKPAEEIERDRTFNPENPYAQLAGKIVAVCYPDNVYDDGTPTLRTLEETLAIRFPSIGGVHILPERLMSHGDVWPQDFLHLLPKRKSKELVEYLQEIGILDRGRHVEDRYAVERSRLKRRLLPAWFAAGEEDIPTDRIVFIDAVLGLLDDAYGSHFNDGGFSQKNRTRVDPRFGSVEDLRRMSAGFVMMLDYVVNHLDFENPILQSFRRGENDGSAFLIATPAEYARMRADGTLEKTFRPRPFPLFTGMRKESAIASKDAPAEMNRRIAAEGLAPLDERLVELLSVDFKIRNDQGLTAADRRIFSRFLAYVAEAESGKSGIFEPSKTQPTQMAYSGAAAGGMPDLLEALGGDRRCAAVFCSHDDEIFGEKFYIYTTFSESQVDINPSSEAGFRLVVDDLFHLLASGDLAMMRMDAIKYLWKEIGGRNFDMEKGNLLIDALRLLMRLAAPRVLPLDEVNSPDPVVYAMGKNGGFAYLFGQVNAVPAAFNSGSLRPIKRFMQAMRSRCPGDLVLFVMLSTHDGRSVQGLGAQRSDGHVSIRELYDLRRVIESRGGHPKLRSVPKGRIPRDTLRKVCSEANLDEEKVRKLFSIDSAGDEDELSLRGYPMARGELFERLVRTAGEGRRGLEDVPAVSFLADWLIDGATVYELCCTTRNAFRPDGSDGRILTPPLEAARLVLAQLYVLTLGQTVPAVYFNDLLGLENDLRGFELSGKPRDLNRHKSHVQEIPGEESHDPFTSAYLPLLNRILEIRACDAAFYPGSEDFEFIAPTDTIFLNHPHARGSHSFILGNIRDVEQKIAFDLKLLDGLTGGDRQALKKEGLVDEITGSRIACRELRTEIVLPPFGAVWLKPAAE